MEKIVQILIKDAKVVLKWLILKFTFSKIKHLTVLITTVVVFIYANEKLVFANELSVIERSYFEAFYAKKLRKQDHGGINKWKNIRLIVNSGQEHEFDLVSSVLGEIRNKSFVDIESFSSNSQWNLLISFGSNFHSDFINGKDFFSRFFHTDEEYISYLNGIGENDFCRSYTHFAPGKILAAFIMIKNTVSRQSQKRCLGVSMLNTFGFEKKLGQESVGHLKIKSILNSPDIFALQDVDFKMIKFLQSRHFSLKEIFQK